jgi:hypothetical protein
MKSSRWIVVLPAAKPDLAKPMATLAARAKTYHNRSPSS